MNRIPNFEGDVIEWTRELAARGLDYHFDDSPEEIVSTSTGARTFSPEECASLRAIVDCWTPQQTELAFATALHTMHLENVCQHFKAIDAQQYRNAGFPTELLCQIEMGNLVPLSCEGGFDPEAQGRLCFHMPHHEETKSTSDLIWHGADPDCWDFGPSNGHPGSRFYVRIEHYHDRDQSSPCGHDIEEFEDIDALIFYIENPN